MNHLEVSTLESRWINSSPPPPYTNRLGWNLTQNKVWGKEVCRENMMKSKFDKICILYNNKYN